LFPDFSVMDNRILGSAVAVADGESDQKVVLVTKDLNLMLKARALGLDAEDYRTDRVTDGDIRLTMRSAEEEYEVVRLDSKELQAFNVTGSLMIAGLRQFTTNQYILVQDADFQDGERGTPARHVGDGRFIPVRREGVHIRNGRSLKALNLGQRFFLDALYNPEITLITVYGKAGTGKTLLSVGAALEQVQDGSYEKFLITRVIMPTGKDIGFLPGRIEEKMQPWVQPAYDALEILLTKPRKPEQFDKKKQSKRKVGGAVAAPTHTSQSSKTTQQKGGRPWEPLLHSGQLEVEAITHIRGRSIPNALFIVDEAQQLTPHEAKTLITRMGRGSKIILIGDLGQIDNPYVDAHTNGLVYARNRLQGQPWMAHVNLFKGERSEMADLAATLM
jgi:PhoH-like ATPase